MLLSFQNNDLIIFIEGKRSIQRVHSYLQFWLKLQKNIHFLLRFVLAIAINAY